jgi:bidirectional [NiFe] hydrogenase diaphorase subunit
MNVDDLAEMAQAYRNEEAGFSHEVRVCMAASCQSSGAIPVLEALDKAYSDAAVGASDKAGHRCKVKGVGCMGLCSAGPLVAVAEQGSDLAGSVLYRDVKPEDAQELLASVGGEPVQRLRCPTDQPFFARQQRVVLENSGVIDPDSLHGLHRRRRLCRPGARAERNDAGRSGAGGHRQRLARAWRRRLPHGAQVVDREQDGRPPEVRGLQRRRGRPGRLHGPQRCSNPTRTGCSKAWPSRAYAVGANKGYIYVRAEYPLAVERLTRRPSAGQADGLPGPQGLGDAVRLRDRDPPGRRRLRLRRRNGAAGSIEGGRGQPRPRPPYPAESGLWGHPTLINNVETFANITPILRNGGKWFAAIGTPKSKGTKVFALAGTIVNTGLIEVPMGTSLRDIIEVIGGGIPGGKAFKAVQTGGPSGGCIPSQHLDVPVDYDSR